MRIIALPPMLLSIVASPNACVCVPGDDVVTLDEARATPMFDEHRDAFSMQGAGAFEFGDDGLTLRDGPGALVLVLDDAHPNYRVSVEANVDEGGNSGVFVRADGGTFYPSGVEVQIDPADPKNPTGSIYDVDTSDAPVPPAGTWFTLDVTAEGARVEALVDGVFAGRTDDAQPNGPLFALQAHHPGSVVHFRNLVIELLP